MKTRLSPDQLRQSLEIYSAILNVDEFGTALDADSLKIVNVLAGLAQAFSLDLYEVIDSFDDRHFESAATFLQHLKELEF